MPPRTFGLVRAPTLANYSEIFGSNSYIALTWSLLFAAVHIHLNTFVPLFVFGVILVWIYERTDTLLAPILTHATFNTINFLLFINQSQIEQWLKRFA